MASIAYEFPFSFQGDLRFSRTHSCHVRDNMHATDANGLHTKCSSVSIRTLFGHDFRTESWHRFCIVSGMCQ